MFYEHSYCRGSFLSAQTRRREEYVWSGCTLKRMLILCFVDRPSLYILVNKSN